MDGLLELLNNRLAFWAALFLVLIFFLSRSIHIAQEGERFAKFLLGRFVGYFGPGLVFSSSSLFKLCRLRVGLVGRLVSPDLAEFEGLQIPVKNVDGIRIGSPVRIEGFSEDGPMLVPSESQPKTVCPNCHHQF